MFNRTIIKEMEDWAKKENRKPLILRGARQVGKTTAVKMFSRKFDSFIYLDLEVKENLELFQKELPINDLIQLIFLSKNIVKKTGRTLIFIDEIQNSPEAIAIMRYFYEFANEYFVIAAGSLLEIMMETNQLSFPVGRVEYKFMYPLTFSEFLSATKNELSKEFYNKIPMPKLSHDKLLSLFHKYSMIGGMPEIIEYYTKTDEIVNAKSIYQSLLTSYMDDVSKYARNKSQINIIRHAIESVAFESGKRIKFYNFGNSNYKSREMGEALRTLERAMLITLVYPTSSTKPPAFIDRKKSPRLQFVDTGLLNFSAGLQADFFKFSDLYLFYQGIIAEHITGQELLAKDMLLPSKLIFWTREQKQSNAEVDFIVQYKNLLIPIEVKSGKTGTLRSLHQFINISEHNYAVRCYSGKLFVEKAITPSGKEYKLLNLPYFLIGKIDEYLDWFIN